MSTPPTLNPKQVQKTIETVEHEQRSAEAGALPVLPLQFMPVLDLTTFAAEVAITDGDFIYHFFANDEINRGPDPKKYWLETFPAILEATAKAYFKADFPRLKAAYTEEQASWWLRAFGFGIVLQPHKMALGFCDALDAALDAAAGA